VLLKKGVLDGASVRINIAYGFTLTKNRFESGVLRLSATIAYVAMKYSTVQSSLLKVNVVVRS